MAKYKVTVPFIPDMGSVSSFFVSSYPSESKYQAALWQLNSMRRHDCLRELTKLPGGLKFERIEG